MGPGSAALISELQEAYNELKAQHVHAEWEAAEAIQAAEESAAEESAAARRLRAELVEAQEELVEAHEESAAQAISAAEESEAAHQWREELAEAQEGLADAQQESDLLMNTVENVEKELAIEKRYFGIERDRNVQLRKVAMQTRAVLEHQCWGHMENI